MGRAGALEARWYSGRQGGRAEGVVRIERSGVGKDCIGVIRHWAVRRAWQYSATGYSCACKCLVLVHAAWQGVDDGVGAGGVGALGGLGGLGENEVWDRRLAFGLGTPLQGHACIWGCAGVCRKAGVIGDWRMEGGAGDSPSRSGGGAAARQGRAKAAGRKTG